MLRGGRRSSGRGGGCPRGAAPHLLLTTMGSDDEHKHHKHKHHKHKHKHKPKKDKPKEEPKAEPAPKTE